MRKLDPVPQRAVAEHLGLSQATVSMALAGHPRIPAETRDRVLAAADELGYRPNPALRSLARYRKSVREPTYHATLAWVHTLNSAEAWKQTRGPLWSTGRRCMKSSQITRLFPVEH